MDLIMRNTISTPTLTALTAGTPSALDFDGADERIVVVVQNTTSSATTLTVKAGNGLQGCVDLTLDVPASSVNLLKLDSGRFKNVSGDNKGKIVVVSPAALKVGVTAMV
ncbi:MAG: hypothetical protein J6U87_05355 [Clostridia bacterium]|nr:hypothetical protein [Clostridia bacterium]